MKFAIQMKFKNSKNHSNITKPQNKFKRNSQNGNSNEIRMLWIRYKLQNLPGSW